MPNFKLLTITFVVILAAFLRLYSLNSYPVSVYWDEAAIGYNAYSLAKTGADEYGKSWPLAFESFNDFKLPGYIYLDSIFVKVLGLSEFSVRLPSAIAGTLAVFLIYLFTKKLFEKNDNKEEIALLAAIVTAVSPWHIQLSRAAFETNIALTVVLLGLYLLLTGIKSRWAAVGAIPALAISFYFYYSSYTFIPLLLLAFAIIYRAYARTNIKYYLAGLLISMLIIAPAIFQLLTSEGSKRVREVSIFENTALYEDYIAASADAHNIVSKVLTNRRIPLLLESLRGYFTHLSPGFIYFGEDPNPRHHPLFQGNFYIWQIPFLVSGLWLLVKLKDNKLKFFLIAFMAIAPIPAAFTIDTPHSLRSYNLLIPLAIITSLGMAHLLKYKLWKIVTAPLAIILITIYFFNYYVIYPISSSNAWAYGYDEMFHRVNFLETYYDRIIVTGYYWKPYIYYLFVNKINPTDYQQNPNQLSIGKYRFGIAGWDTGGANLNDELIDSLSGDRTLVILSPEEFKGLKDPDRFTKISEVLDYSGNEIVFLIGRWQ